jgi:hypothetical protein
MGWCYTFGFDHEHSFLPYSGIHTLPLYFQVPGSYYPDHASGEKRVQGDAAAYEQPYEWQCQSTCCDQHQRNPDAEERGLYRF